jgi:hypothetical protein
VQLCENHVVKLDVSQNIVRLVRGTEQKIELRGDLEEMVRNLLLVVGFHRSTVVLGVGRIHALQHLLDSLAGVEADVWRQFVPDATCA